MISVSVVLFALFSHCRAEIINFSGASVAITIPHNCSAIAVSLCGAAGGSVPSNSHGPRTGGYGAKLVSQSISVTSGSTIYINVGGTTFNCGAGYNGGGSAQGVNCDSYAGGGGATDIRLDSSDGTVIAIAGGGGGVTGGCVAHGGDAGYDGASGCYYVGTGYGAGTGGGGGSTSWSVGGGGGTNGLTGGSQGNQFKGGRGDEGGGGGGGYYGGGGGDAYGGGGGGSSYCIDTTAVITTDPVCSGHGQANITFLASDGSSKSSSSAAATAIIIGVVIGVVGFVLIAFAVYWYVGGSGSYKWTTVKASAVACLDEKVAKKSVEMVAQQPDNKMYV